MDVHTHFSKNRRIPLQNKKNFDHFFSGVHHHLVSLRYYREWIFIVQMIILKISIVLGLNTMFIF